MTEKTKLAVFFKIDFGKVMKPEYGVTTSKEELAYKLYALRNANPNDMHFVVPGEVHFYEIDEETGYGEQHEKFDIKTLTEWASKNLNEKEKINIEKFVNDQKKWENEAK